MSDPKVKDTCPLLEEPQPLGVECKRFVLVSPLTNSFDPMAARPPVNLESTPDETVIDCEESADSEKKSKKCCFFKIGSGIAGSLIAILTVVAKGVGRSEHVIASEFALLGRAAVITADTYQRQENDNHYIRYPRMVDAQEIDDFRDYDSIDFHDKPLFDKPFKPEKSSRRRRDLKMKNKFDKEGINLSTKIVHHDTSAVKLFLTSVRLQHEPKAGVAITRDQKKFFRRVNRGTTRRGG